MNMTKVSKKTPILDCEQSPSALIDLIILIAVIGSCGFLLYPYVTILLSETLGIIKTIMSIVHQEVLSDPIIYECLATTILGTLLVVLAIILCRSNYKCGKPGCRGLKKEIEFDIKVETEEECIKNSDSLDKELKKGLFEFPKDYHRELEDELKKMAPPNGRVVLVFRAKCGCPVVRLEASGPKKNNRKMKR
uniref:uncharacterized protein At5g19025-like n=1 Tax=Erigeron canadensis TaxID=72917 RepID=UPI001CB9C24E|nr:uncharacterized protein At5g19025-like [Erigeron canadensis]